MKHVLVFFLLIISFLLRSQNLVINPSFELYSQCPDGLSTPTDDEVLGATGWSSYRETPDYFNVCSTFSGVSVPDNNAGYQFAHTGNAYCGGATYNKNALYREIIGSQLSSPLTIGQKYYVSFYVSLGGKPGFDFATNNLGAKFVTSAYNYLSNPIPVTNYAQVNYDTLIADTSGWKLIFGSFIADSAYQYIALGNFFDDLNTDTFCIDTSTIKLDGYYFIDDICVSTDSNYCANWTGIKDLSSLNAFIIYPNPISQKAVLKFANPNNELYTLLIYDNEGQIVQTTTDIISDQIEIERKEMKSGLYFFQLRSSKNLLSGKLIFE